MMGRHGPKMASDGLKMPHHGRKMAQGPRTWHLTKSSEQLWKTMSLYVYVSLSLSLSLSLSKVSLVTPSLSLSSLSLSFTSDPAGERP